ncbi:MAG TPA: (2Fe-2S) ferredoxin domain-containing protein [Pseudomonas sp.]|nr:(2Fe-2S) ferredoxin domain-containing protein [Pseudomonas sp.]
MNPTPYARVLFAGSGLNQSAFADLLRQRLSTIPGVGADDLIDITEGYEPLWAAARASARPLLLVDLEPQGGSGHVDWLRSQLAECGDPEQGFVASLVSQEDASLLDGVPTLLERRELHLSCVGVPKLPSHHAWSEIPAHDQRLLLCNGPRCSRRGALDLWKTLRLRLKAAGRLQCAGGVHITRTQCQFPCDLGPVASLYPANEWFRVRDEAEVIRLVDERLVDGKAVPELRIDQP